MSIFKTSSRGQKTNGINEYLISNISDKNQLPKSAPGSTAFCLQNGITYMYSPEKLWIAISTTNNQTSVDNQLVCEINSGITKVYEAKEAFNTWLNNHNITVPCVFILQDEFLNDDIDFLGKVAIVNASDSSYYCFFRNASSDIIVNQSNDDQSRGYVIQSNSKFNVIKIGESSV